MLKKIIRFFYKKYCSSDVVWMTREQLGVFGVPLDLEKFDKEKNEQFYVDARDLLENYVFQHIMNEVVEDIKDKMVHTSEDSALLLDRFSINGVYLLKERVEHYANLVPKTDVQFDKYAIT